MGRLLIAVAGMGLLLPLAAGSLPAPPGVRPAELQFGDADTDEVAAERPGPFLTSSMPPAPGMVRSLRRLPTSAAQPAQFPQTKPTRPTASSLRKPFHQLRLRMVDLFKPRPATAPLAASRSLAPAAATASAKRPPAKALPQPVANDKLRQAEAQFLDRPAKTSAPIDRASLAFEGADQQPPEPMTLPPLATALPPSPSACLAVPAEHRTWYWCTAKMRFCQSPLGRLTRLALTPVRLGTGMPQCCCDVPSPALLGRMERENASLPEMTAAKIKVDEAGAAARLAAVHYLAGVDCHYYPEAEEALLAALRCDRNECVRQEAARALGNGRCVSRRVIETLQVVVSATDEDHNPAETSDHVRAAAFASLQRCLAQPDKILGSPESSSRPAALSYLGRGPGQETAAKLQQIRHTSPSPPEHQRTEDAIAAAWRLLAENVSTAPPASSSSGRTDGLQRSSVEPGRRGSVTGAMGLQPIGRIPE